ncbi:MAG: SMP-30/gluconolactonase/LRE family protein [Desulfuromonadales bacterium]
MTFSGRPGRIHLPVMAVCRLVMVLTVSSLMAGCVKPLPTGDGKRYLWPASSVDAKIEYLGFYASDVDLRHGKYSWLEEVVLGKDLGRPLFGMPHAIDVRYGKLAVVDQGLNRVLLLDMTDPDKVFIGEGTETQSGLNLPTGVALTASREVWVVDSAAANVHRYSMDGKLLGVFGQGHLTRPTAIAVSRSDEHVVVVDTARHGLAIFGKTGKFIGFLGERGIGPGQFNFPVDADFGPDGELFVLDSMNARVQKFLRDGDTYRFAGEFGERGMAAGSFSIAKALAVTPSGHVYVTDSMSNKVVVFDRDGTFLLTFGGRYSSVDGKVAPGGFTMPRGIAADENDGVWVVDSFNRMVHRFQYLNEDYLRDHPISSDQVFLPTPWGKVGR